MCAAVSGRHHAYYPGAADECGCGAESQSTYRPEVSFRDCDGGAIGVPGNVSPVAEFNMYVDPHAAHRVFQAALPLTLVPLDVTTRVGLRRDVLKMWTGASRDPRCRIVADMTAKAFDFAEQVEGHGLLYFHDPMAVLAAIEPSLLKTEPLHVEVEVVGRVSRGATVADRRHRRPEEKRTRTCRSRWTSMPSAH